MPTPDQALLIDQHREMELGIGGLVDGSGSRAELDQAVRLLRRHIHVEEAVLFPLIREDTTRWMALSQMEGEHGQMWPHIEAAIELLDNKVPLDDLLPACSAMLQLLHEHDPKEEEAIYSVLDRYSAVPGNPPLAHWFRSLEIPPGWRCLRAPGG